MNWFGRVLSYYYERKHLEQCVINTREAPGVVVEYADSLQVSQIGTSDAKMICLASLEQGFASRVNITVLVQLEFSCIVSSRSH